MRCGAASSHGWGIGDGSGLAHVLEAVLFFRIPQGSSTSHGLLCTVTSVKVAVLYFGGEGEADLLQYRFPRTGVLVVSRLDGEGNGDGAAIVGRDGDRVDQIAFSAVVD